MLCVFGVIEVVLWRCVVLCRWCVMLCCVVVISVVYIYIYIYIYILHFIIISFCFIVFCVVL